MNRKTANEIQRARREMLGHLACRSKRIPSKRLKSLICTSEGAQRRVWSRIAKTQSKTGARA
jgi:hypothetical protein